MTDVSDASDATDMDMRDRGGLLPVADDRYASIRRQSPARILIGRAGNGYPTQALLSLRADHAAARDAVRSRVDLEMPAWNELRAHGLFEVASLARTPEEHLLQPQLGRRLSDPAKETLMQRCVAGPDVQIVLGDGLSAQALAAQAPALVAQLVPRVAVRGWSLGTTFFVRHCRVDIMNDIGALLRPRLVALLIGERPGLRTALSLSAYLAYRPTIGHSNADRNLISNIHTDGVLIADAADRILDLFAEMDRRDASGLMVKEVARPGAVRQGVDAR
jgi:ethanolamine ammonia-lyase small subunit